MEEIKALTEDKLQEITKSGRVVLEFSAAWCPDCRFLDPFLPEIEKDFSEAKFYKIDRDDSIDVAKKLSKKINDYGNSFICCLPRWQRNWQTSK